MASVSPVAAETRNRRRTGKILVYAARNEVASRQAVHLGQGIVFHGRKGLIEARRLRGTGHLGELAVDPERYLKLKEQPLQLLSDHELCAAEQADLGVSFFLAPSLPPQQTDASLTQVLFEGEQFLRAVDALGGSAPAYVPLVVTPYWLTKGLETMLRAVHSFGGPVALVFAAPFDPLETRAAVEGALRLAGSTPDVFILRSDLSAIGLVAACAAGGSIGASATTRHLAMPLKNARSATKARDESLHVFTPRLFNWPRGSKLEHISDDLALFVCNCIVCGGASVLRFRDPARAVEAEQHAVAAWAAVADEVLSADNGVAAWKRHLVAARDAYHELEDEGVALQRPGFIGAWLSLL